MTRPSFSLQSRRRTGQGCWPRRMRVRSTRLPRVWPDRGARKSGIRSFLVKQGQNYYLVAPVSGQPTQLTKSSTDFWGLYASQTTREQPSSLTAAWAALRAQDPCELKMMTGLLQPLTGWPLKLPAVKQRGQMMMLGSTQCRQEKPLGSAAAILISSKAKNMVKFIISSSVQKIIVQVYYQQLTHQERFSSQENVQRNPMDQNEFINSVLKLNLQMKEKEILLLLILGILIKEICKIIKNISHLGFDPNTLDRESNVLPNRLMRLTDSYRRFVLKDFCHYSHLFLKQKCRFF